MSRYGLEIRATAAFEAPFLSQRVGIPAAVLAERLAAVGQAAGAMLIAVEWGAPSGIARITPLLVGPDQRRRGSVRLLEKAAARAADGGVLEVAASPAAPRDGKRSAGPAGSTRWTASLRGHGVVMGERGGTLTLRQRRACHLGRPVMAPTR